MKLWNISYWFARSGRKPVWTIPWTRSPWQCTISCCGLFCLANSREAARKAGCSQATNSIFAGLMTILNFLSCPKQFCKSGRLSRSALSHPLENRQQHPVEMPEALLSCITQCVIDIPSGSGPGSRSESAQSSSSNYSWPRRTALVQQYCFQDLHAALHYTTHTKLLIPSSFSLCTSLRSLQGGIWLCASYCTMLQYRDSASTFWWWLASR